jgi:FixJ family two-component response regulator
MMFTGEGGIKLAAHAMKAGVFDFIEKPVGQVALLACISRARPSQNIRRMSMSSSIAPPLRLRPLHPGNGR